MRNIGGVKVAQLKLKNVCKCYKGGRNSVISQFNLEVLDGEFIVLVGPSGCGKSTLLRMIAGLEEVSSGEIYVDGMLVNEVSPKDRNIAMVFQSYALYPHFTVYDNMAFGLKSQQLSKREIDRRVKEAAAVLGLEAYLTCKPGGLSGGQQQRVALGRAMVREAKLLLMDEPLSNLDAPLRGAMRLEIMRLHKRLGTTTLYVTHDQLEAMTMASRIIVMNERGIQQVASPKELYESPLNMFVGGFIGSYAMNFLRGNVVGDTFVIDDFSLRIPKGKVTLLKKRGYLERPIVLGIRPEDIYADPIVLDTYQEAKYQAMIEMMELLGHEVIITTTVKSQSVVAVIDSRFLVAGNLQLELAFDMNKCHFFDPETEESIR